jgi:hypothetical protein
MTPPRAAAVNETTMDAPVAEGVRSIPLRARGRPRARRRTLALRTPLACLCYMLVLIGVCAGIDRAVANRLFAAPHDFVPAYRSFPEYAFGVKLHQLAGVRDRVDTLFIGNSRTLFGVRAGVFDRRLAAHGERVSSYNLGLPSVDVRFWPTFFGRYDRGPAPRHVLLGLLPRDLDAHFQMGGKLSEAFLASAGFENRDMSSVSRWSEEEMANLFLLRGRSSDLRLVHPSDILHGRKLDLHPIHLADGLGFGKLPSTNVLSEAALRQGRARLAVRHGSTPFVLGEQQRRSLIALNQRIRRGGGCLTLYTTPLLYDEELWGTVEMRRGFMAAMRRLVAQLPGVQFVNVGGQAQHAYGPRDFGDGDHLNARGATRFSGQLADALAPVLRGPSCP